MARRELPNAIDGLVFLVVLPCFGVDVALIDIGFGDSESMRHQGRAVLLHSGFCSDIAAPRITS